VVHAGTTELRGVVGTAVVPTKEYWRNPVAPGASAAWRFV
jgi:hypothetical protein